jgi:site-specific DNA recombinase
MCGKRYVGAAAHGRNGRYEYYVCFSRQRYGSAVCAAERLPARELEEAVIAAIGSVYSDTGLVDQAFATAVERAQATNGKLEEEQRRAEAERKKTESAIDRYLTAFEDGSMPAEQCGPRLERLSERLRQLQARQAELDELADTQPERPDHERVAALQGQLTYALQRGEVATVKTVLRELVASVEVHDHRLVRPHFRVPSAVRTRSGLLAG